MLEFSSDMIGITNAKREIVRLMQQYVQYTIEDFLAINTALDELLFNILEHSNNGNGTFIIDYKMENNVVEFSISDCGLINTNSKRAKRITAESLKKNRVKVNGGKGLKMAADMSDSLEIYKVDKTKHGSTDGYIFKMVKCVNGTKLPNCIAV